MKVRDLKRKRKGKGKGKRGIDEDKG